ncbi:MAG: hypothetical protein WD271_09430 [Acidimicrobiia bacterium]
MSDQVDDPFERAAERFTRWGGWKEWRKHQLSGRLKWLAFFVLTLPLHLYFTDWEITTLVVVQFVLITLSAIGVAWAWIDVSSEPSRRRGRRSS